jgi:hypothetical protein
MQLWCILFIVVHVVVLNKYKGTEGYLYLEIKKRQLMLSLFISAPGRALFLMMRG